MTIRHMLNDKISRILHTTRMTGQQMTDVHFKLSCLEVQLCTYNTLDDNKISITEDLYQPNVFDSDALFL
jgi:hypothetical protein